MAQEGRDEKGRFEKNNLFCLGGYGYGRPAIYTEPEKMYEKIAEYLEWEDHQKDGAKKDKGIYTLEGCALYLGFASVQSLYDYEKRDSGFSYIISKYRLFLTDWHVKKLYWGGTYMAAQFWLRNHGGYKEESDVNQTVTNITAQFGTAIPTAHESSEDSPIDK
jgi:hypothetical protein